MLRPGIARAGPFADELRIALDGGCLDSGAAIVPFHA